jgi:hypothetical protein
VRFVVVIAVAWSIERMKFSHIESEIHLSCLEVIYMYDQPRVAACCEMSSVSQSVISTTLRFKAESRRATADGCLRHVQVEKFMSSQMEDGKDAQWSVNMYLHVKTCLDYLWRGLDASLVSEGN